MKKHLPLLFISFLLLSVFITKAQNNNNLYIAAITLWQIAKLVQQKQLHVYARLSDFLNNITNIEGLNVIGLNSNIAAESHWMKVRSFAKYVFGSDFLKL